MSQDKERREVIKVAESLQWRVTKQENKSGYLKMLCPCGSHKKWLHKTPSNPHYWKETIQYLQTVCEKPEQ